MYTLRGRDLSGLREGLEAARAAESDVCSSTPSWPTQHSPEPVTLTPQAPRSHHRPSKVYTPRRGRGNRYTGNYCGRDIDSPRRCRPGSHHAKHRSASKTRGAERQEQHRAEDYEDDGWADAITQTEASSIPEVEALKKRNQELSDRLVCTGRKLVKANERIHRLEQLVQQLRGDEQCKESHPEKCSAQCCIPISRLQKAGLNVEPLSELDAMWAGYVFSLASVQVRSSGMTFSEVFRKHRNNIGRLDEASFKLFIRQFFSDIQEDRLTRLFYFADTDGSGNLNFLEFLRLFGCDLNGKMGEEYFEHVMVRVHHAITKRGGVFTVLQTFDRQSEGMVNKKTLVDFLLDLRIGLNRRETLDLANSFDTEGTGHINIRHFADTMNMCVSACFVTEEWVHKLFDQVVSAVHSQSRSLYAALQPVALAGGLMNRDTVGSFLRQFQPSLRDTQIDRVFSFLTASSERASRSRNGLIDLSHFLHVVCQPSLGPSQLIKGKKNTRLPSEVLEKLALQLNRLCGDMSTAFDYLNPCICVEEFAASLQSLGFAPGMDFSQTFRLLDVNRNGRIERSTFIQVLERHVKRLQGFNAAGGTNPWRPTFTERENHAANKIIKFYRELLTRRNKKSKRRPTISTSATFAKTEVWEQRLQAYFAILHGRKPEMTDVMPLGQHIELMKDQQRAINRIMVLENELHYARLNVTVGAATTRFHKSETEDVRELESANRQLAFRLQNMHIATREMFNSHDMLGRLGPAVAGIKRSSSLPARRPRYHTEMTRHCFESPGEPEEGGVSGEMALRLELVEAQEIIETLSSEKESLIASHARSSLVQDQYSSNHRSPSKASRKETVGLNIEVDGKHYNILEFKNAVREFGSNSVEVRDTDLHQLKNALMEYRTTKDADSFVDRVHGLALRSRYRIRKVASFDAAFAVLECEDVYVSRDVACKVPLTDTLQTRCAFLREFVIYSILRDVVEVPDVYHFPGIHEDLVYCIMEQLRGDLLCNHLQDIQAGQQLPLTPHEAAEICDAFLYGISECHVRGVLHLDLKPSVVWIATKPAKVVVKILDFGHAHLMNRNILAPDARLLFEQNLPEPQVTIAADFNLVAPESRPPELHASVDTWKAFAPYAILTDVGTPLYMCPSRWCSMVMSFQQPNVLPHDMRWAASNAGRSMFIESGTGEQPDLVVVGHVDDQARVVQTTVPAFRYPEGHYFEISINKVWPRHLLVNARSSQDNSPGLAMGFTLSPPHDVRLPNNAYDVPNSWVIGYDGRIFRNSQEIPYFRDEAPSDSVQNFRRSLSKNDSAEAIDWGDGPLGWSFAECGRGDYMGLLATHQGHLAVYINQQLVSKVHVDGLAGNATLYPLLDLCGRAREVSLDPQPRGPSGEAKAELGAQDYADLEKHMKRDTQPSVDVYAAALIVQQCFASSVPLPIARSFASLLKITSHWFEQQRPALLEHSNMLFALSEWCHSPVDTSFEGVPESVAELLASVHKACNSIASSASHESNSIATAHTFRVALNKLTSWSHMSPEFLASHVKQKAVAKTRDTVASGNARMKWKAARTSLNIQVAPAREAHLWDLSPWTLSSSHVYRVLQVLQSPESENIGMIRISRFEAGVPPDLIKRLADSFYKPIDFGDSIDSHQLAMAEKAIEGMQYRIPRIRLFFGSEQFPSINCSVPYAKLQESNAIGLVLRVVRRVNVSDPSADHHVAPIGPKGAATLADALMRNVVLTELKASGQLLGDEGANYLGNALQLGSGLQTLDLRSNGITEAGVKALAEALALECATLQSLNLAQNDIGNAGCQHLASMLRENTSLTYLSLQRNAIGEDGAFAVGSALSQNTTLRELDIGRNDIGLHGSSKIVGATRANASLTNINMQDNSLDSLAALAIAALLAPLEEQKIERKSVAFDPESQSRMQLLQSATIQSNQIRILNLRHNLLGNSGVAALLKALRNNSSLQGLNLAWNDLAGEAAQGLAELFGKDSLSQLKELDLRDNMFGEGAVLGFAFLALGRTKQEDASPPTSPLLGSRKSRWFAVTDTLPRNSIMSGATMTQKNTALLRAIHFRPYVSLRFLNLANNDLDGYGLQLLSLAMPFFICLEVLLLYNNISIGCWRDPLSVGEGAIFVSDAGLSPPASPTLGPRTSDLDGLLAFLRSLPQSLARLSLGSCNLEDEQAAEILKALSAGRTALNDLDFSDNRVKVDTHFLDGFYSLLRTSPNMSTFSLALNAVEDEPAAQLARLISASKSSVVVDVSANNVSATVREVLSNRSQTPQSPRRASEDSPHERFTGGHREAFGV